MRVTLRDVILPLTPSLADALRDVFAPPETSEVQLFRVFVVDLEDFAYFFSGFLFLVVLLALPSPALL